MALEEITSKSEIIQKYGIGISIEEILKEYSIEEHNLRGLLKKEKIDRKGNFYTEELYDRIVILYLTGKTQKEICYDLLISPNGINSALKRKGIIKRTYSECNKRYKRNQHYFDNIDTPNKAYILGLLYADGCNFTKHNSITLSLQESDKHILESIKQELDYTGKLRFNPLNLKNNRYKNHYILNINDEYLSRRLNELGVVANKSLKIVFPHFIRGYFDGDGCIYIDKKRNKCQTQTVGTKDFCEHLSDILNKMGCKNNIKHPKQCHENTYVIQTSGNKSSYIFLSWLYENSELKIQRKYCIS